MHVLLGFSDGYVPEGSSRCYGTKNILQESSAAPTWKYCKMDDFVRGLWSFLLVKIFQTVSHPRPLAGGVAHWADFVVFSGRRDESVVDL
jgi:hypothetical protein